MSEWKEVRLGDISTMKYGKLPPKNNIGEIPIYSGYKIIGYNSVANCDKGTIIIVARGVGGCGDVKIIKNNCFLTNLSISVELDNNICLPIYFYYRHLLNNLSFLNTGSAQPQITIESLQKYNISLPTIKEQKEIAGILSSLDAKIETNNKLNEKLEEMAQAIFKSWLNSCHDTVSIEDLSLNITDYTKNKKDNVILINSSDVTDGYFEHHNFSENINIKGHFKKRFSKGDILYSQVRPRNRHWAYCYFNAEDYIASTQLMVIRNKEDKLSSLLLYQYLISDRVWNEFTLKTETRSGTFPQGNYEELSKICVPYKKDNKLISMALESIYNNIYNLYEENLRLASLRDTLLPRLMSGEIKV